MDANDEVTANEASEILGVSAHQVRWYHANGYLPGRRIGARILLFPRADVEKLKDNKPKKTGRPPLTPAPEVKDEPPPEPDPVPPDPAPTAKPKGRKKEESTFFTIVRYSAFDGPQEAVGTYKLKPVANGVELVLRIPPNTVMPYKHNGKVKSYFSNTLLAYPYTEFFVIYDDASAPIWDSRSVRPLNMEEWLAMANGSKAWTKAKLDKVIAAWPSDQTGDKCRTSGGVLFNVEPEAKGKGKREGKST